MKPTLELLSELGIILLIINFCGISPLQICLPVLLNAMQGQHFIVDFWNLSLQEKKPFKSILKGYVWSQKKKNQESKWVGQNWKSTKLSIYFFASVVKLLYFPSDGDAFECCAPNH